MGMETTDKMKNSGTYAILNLVTVAFYIGSTVDLNSRCLRHFRELRSNTHINTHLQRSFNKYKENNFVFETLLTCPIKQARKYEQCLLSLLKDDKGLLNISLVVGEPNTNRKLTEKHKEKIGKANAVSQKGKHLSEETKIKIGVASRMRIRKPFSNEAKQKMRLAKLGKPAPWNSYPRSSEWGRKTVKVRWVKEKKEGYV